VESNIGTTQVIMKLIVCPINFKETVITDIKCRRLDFSSLLNN